MHSVQLTCSIGRNGSSPLFGSTFEGIKSETEVNHGNGVASVRRLARCPFNFTEIVIPSIVHEFFNKFLILHVADACL